MSHRQRMEDRDELKVIGQLPGEHPCLSLVWAVLDRASTDWRGFGMTADGLRLLHDLRHSPLSHHHNYNPTPPRRHPTPSAPSPNLQHNERKPASGDLHRS